VHFRHEYRHVSTVMSIDSASPFLFIPLYKVASNAQKLQQMNLLPKHAPNKHAKITKIVKNVNNYKSFDHFIFRYSDRYSWVRKGMNKLN